MKYCFAQGDEGMKSIWFLIQREIRLRGKQLFPFVLIEAALIFTAVSLVTFQESANTENSIDYIATPTYMILLVSFALIGFVASKTFFSLLNERLLSETGILRALGMKRNMIRRFQLLLGGICIGIASLFALPTALAYIYFFVKACASVDMSLTSFVPLVYRIPFGNIVLVMLLLISAMLAGVLAGQVKEKSIAVLTRAAKFPLEAENNSGDLPETGDLTDYGKLYIRRSIKRCFKYNTVIAFLLILPTIFLLGAATFEIDSSTHTYTLWRISDVAITDEMLEEVEQIPGVLRAEKAVPMKAGFGNEAIGIRIYAEEGADAVRLRDAVTEYNKMRNMKMDDTAVKREISNSLNLSYVNLFLTNAVILFAAGCMTSFGLLKARLAVRGRELSLLRALGASDEEIMKAVTPETFADYGAGALLSVIFGVLGFMGIMADGGGNYSIPLIFFLCPLLLAGSIFAQIKASRHMTAKITSGADIRL